MSGVYGAISMVEHACAANAVHGSVVGGVRVRGEVVLVTARDVARGEHLALDYLGDPLRCSWFRRRQLSWRGFVCRCALCVDPTERGLYLASWCCRPCSRK